MIAKTRGTGEDISQYELSDREMAVGSTLGSPNAALVIKATGALEKIFSSQIGADMFGTLVLHYWDRCSGIPLVAAPGRFIIHPHRQDHAFTLANGVSVYESIFMLHGLPFEEDRSCIDPPAAYYSLRLRNDGGRPVEFCSYASVHLRGACSGRTFTAYDSRRHAFVVHNGDRPDLYRIVASSRKPDSYEVTLDAAKASAVDFPGTLSNRTLDTDEQPIAIFHFDNKLDCGESIEHYFVLTFSAEGKSGAKSILTSLPDARHASERTERHYQVILDRSVIVTPDAEINRGVLWAKANVLRSLQHTAQGWCFVNDPTRSNNCVARDTAWFCMGADYLIPKFTRDALLWFAEHLTPRGMVVEYFDIRNGQAEDFGLNINDDTPLMAIALWHHYCATGDEQFLQRVFPYAKRMADCILSQRNGQGLVWCRSGEDSPSGKIVGWRNIIPGYQLTGATTEVNSECYAALLNVSKMAHAAGDAEAERRYADAATALRGAINEHLLDRSRSLYLLNIGEDGTRHTDVTSDLVFPVLFGVADHDVATNVIAALSRPEFWTEAGLHTVPRNDITYGPAHGHGLLGGVWAGPTFWYAAAAAKFNPEFMSFALAASFRHYAEDPRRYNTVPGQFSEWLHGETLTNQGMMLSPWFAPKYLWAALEGAAGLDVEPDPATVTPRLPAGWQWMGVRNVPVRGKDLAWFAVRTGSVATYANFPSERVDEDRRYERDATDEVDVTGDEAIRIVLERPGKTVIFVGNTLDRTITTSLKVNNDRLLRDLHLRTYSSLVGEWHEEPSFNGGRLRDGLPVNVARHGFHILEMEERP